MADASKFPEWNSNEQGESLVLVYQWAIRNAQDHIAWYVQRKEIQKRWSQRLRAMSIISAAVGAVCPLVQATHFFGNTLTLGQWGYVLLALSAAFISYDRFFGLSSGWMRYMVTQLALEKMLKAFQYDWIMLTARQESKDMPETGPLEMLQELKEFSLGFDAVIQKETNAWVAEFQSNISKLEKKLRAEAETRKVGVK